MQLHPYIINLIAEDRIAQLHAQAESDRLARAAARQRKEAKLHVTRDRILGRRASAQRAAWSSPRHTAHPLPQEDRQLVSVGRAGSDDCL
jgi:hypothetical protein